MGNLLLLPVNQDRSIRGTKRGSKQGWEEGRAK